MFDKAKARDAASRFARHGSDTALEAIILLGFVGMGFLLLFHAVPDKNAQHFSQTNGALIVIATLVAKSLWERRGTEGANAETSAIRAETTRDLAAKVAPAGTAETVDRSVAAAPAPAAPPAAPAEDLPDYAR